MSEANDHYSSTAWRQVSHEKDRQKPAVSISEREKEARELKLSFGVYMGYLESGYLETYRREYKRKKLHETLNKEKVNVVSSNIIGGK